MMEPVGWGMVGVGGVAGLVGPVFATTDDARLVGVTSRDPAKTQGFATAQGAARTYDQFEDLLDDPQIEVVYLGTPNWMHKDQTLQALAAGKHVLVEKPMALTIADAEAMVEAADQARRLLGVGFHLRHHPLFVELQRRLQSGSYGPIVLLQGQWGIDMSAVTGWKVDPERAGAGSIMGLGVHLIDLMNWLTGRAVRSVTGRADGPSDRYPVEFLTLGAFEFDDGAFGQLTCSRRLSHSRNHLTVYTPAGRLTAEGAVSMRGEGELIIEHNGDVERLDGPLDNPYRAEISAFSRAVREGTPFAASGRDGLKVVKVTTALIEAARSGQTQTIGDAVVL
jgi:1,5-anhydro-D-fructose reductase (1,5-anhydro-D-mannitol-forming)